MQQRNDFNFCDTFGGREIHLNKLDMKKFSDVKEGDNIEVTKGLSKNAKLDKVVKILKTNYSLKIELKSGLAFVACRVSQNLSEFFTFSTKNGNFAYKVQQPKTKTKTK